VTLGTVDVSVTDDTLTTEMSTQFARQQLPVLPGPRLDLPRPDVAAAADTAALIGDPVRAGILAILRDGPHCVCEMAAALEVRQNNLSNHLAKLRDAGLVRASRHKVDARWVYYERDEDAVAAASRTLTRVL
jgi:DNA-binding transcriptional ArsR family regulator